MTLAEQLAHHCAREVDAADRERAQRHVLAWTGAAALAASTPTAARYHDGLGGLAGPADAWHGLMFEASLGSLFELDDTHRQGLVHPAPVIVPTVFAVGRRQRVSGQSLLDAVVRGYEAMIRLGMSVGPAHYRYWHNTSSCGAVGAAVASAGLLGLDPGQTAHAIRLALVQSSGLWQTRLDACDAKPWHLSRTAQTGVQAAYLARAGVRGPDHALEGEKGFYAAMCPDAEPQALTCPSGPDWQIHATSFKPWAACRHAHPSIDAALGLRKAWLPQAAELPWSAVASISVQTYADAIAFCDRVAPVDADQARFSLQHAVAVALSLGSPAPSAFDVPMILSADIAALRTLTRVHRDDAFERRYPRHFGASVTVRWQSGATLHHDVQDTLGDPEKPLGDQALLALAEASLEQAGWSRARRETRLAQTRALIDDTHGDWQAQLPVLGPVA